MSLFFFQKNNFEQKYRVYFLTGTKDDLTSFTALNGWLKTFKLAYGIRETRIVGEAGDIPRMTIQSWIDELGLSLKALPEKGLVRKSGSCKGDKNSKQCFPAAFFVAADGSKVSEPVVVKKQITEQS